MKRGGVMVMLRSATRRLTITIAISMLAMPVGVTFIAPCVGAQVFPGDQVPVRPIRIEGYWGRTKAEQAVIGQMTLSADGRDRRSFGVTALQAYKPEEEGMSAIRHTSLQPAVLLRGSDDLVKKLYGAKPEQKVTIFGVYGAGAGTLTLSSVE